MVFIQVHGKNAFLIEGQHFDPRYMGETVRGHATKWIIPGTMDGLKPSGYQ